VEDLLYLREVCRDFEDAVENYVPNIWLRIYKELGHHNAWKITTPYVNRYFLKYMDIPDEHGQTALTSISGENEEKAIFLIKNGADVNHTTVGGCDALTRCFIRRRRTIPVPLILILLQKGFQMDCNDERVFRILGATLNRSDKEELKQWEEIVFLLIERGCNIANDQCMTYAFRNMSFELVKYLISKGVEHYSTYMKDLRYKLSIDKCEDTNPMCKSYAKYIRLQHKIDDYVNPGSVHNNAYWNTRREDISTLELKVLLEDVFGFTNFRSFRGKGHMIDKLNELSRERSRR
jgi:hypothetical protein